MYKNCKTPESVQRQLHIINCMFEMLKTQRFRTLTISSLRKKAGIPRKSFYRYFDSKEDVWDAAVDFLILKLGEDIFLSPEADPKDIEKNVEKLFLFFFEHQGLQASLVESNLNGSLIQQLIAKTYASVSRKRIPFPGESNHTFRITYYFTSCSLLILVIDWCQRGCPETPREMTRTVMHLFTKPLIASKEPQKV